MTPGTVGVHETVLRLISASWTHVPQMRWRLLGVEK